MRTARFNGHLYREASTQGVCVCVQGGWCLPSGGVKGGCLPRGSSGLGSGLARGVCPGGCIPLGHRVRHPLPHLMLGHTPTGGQEE